MGSTPTQSMGDAWRELHRSNDAREAVNVLTTIAAMEFEARCAGAGQEEGSDGDEGPSLGRPPYIIEVREEDWLDLRGVLESLLAEQEEFDREHEARQARKRRFERWMVAVVALGALITMLLASFGCSNQDRGIRHTLRCGVH